MNISQRGIDFIKQFEGFSSKAIRLSGEKYYTIGYGHYGEDVKPGTVITLAEGEALLRKDLAYFVTTVNEYVKRYARFTPNQNQFDALVSFCYNCGAGNLRTLIAGRDAKQVANAILYYTKSSNPAFTQGLLNRRRKERAMFLEDDIMTGEEIYKALTEYLATLEPPAWAKKELKEAKDLGITDGSNPMQFIPRYQAAIMAKRAKK